MYIVIFLAVIEDRKLKVALKEMIIIFRDFDILFVLRYLLMLSSMKLLIGPGTVFTFFKN